jgi:hypothetical protein
MRILGMDLKEVVLNYLTDNDERMNYLITWFLNEVMQRKRISRPVPGDTGGPVQGKRTGTAILRGRSRPGMVN